VFAIDGFDKAPIVAVAATAGFVLFSLVKPLGRFVPPVVAALAAGAVAIAILGGFHPREGAAGLLADPVFFVPKFSEAALLDLVLPLTISVVVLQNAQGIGILRMYRHDPPPNTITLRPTATGRPCLSSAMKGSDRQKPGRSVPGQARFDAHPV